MDGTRYGVFLRPDPVTCWVVSQLTTVLAQQFGLVSAAAFPPHATLVGNLATEATAAELVERLDPVFAAVRPFPVHNAGLVRLGDCFLFDVHTDGAGAPNAPLVAVAAAVKDALLPMSVPVRDHLAVPVAENTFWGHLSIASHDLMVDPHLADEVGEFLAGLPLRPPSTFSAEVYSLFAFEGDWATAWWHTMTWRHLRSWPVGPRRAGPPRA